MVAFLFSMLVLLAELKENYAQSYSNPPLIKSMVSTREILVN